MIPNTKAKITKSDEAISKQVVVGQRHWGIHYSWIPQYVYQRNFDFIPYKDIESLQNGKVLLIFDKKLKSLMLGEDDEDDDGYIREKLSSIYNETNTRSSYNDKHPYDRDVYPYTSLHQNRRVDIMELRTNY